MELTTNASFERVVIVTLGRGHAFSDMESIKKELSAKVMELAPRRLSHNAQVHYKISYFDITVKIMLFEPLILHLPIQR